MWALGEPCGVWQDCAAFHLHRLMLEYERASLVGVAREANRVLRRRGSHLLGRHRAVRIVAVGALNQALIHPVVKGHVELRLLLQMAGVAKLGLSLDQQEFLRLWRGAANGRRCS